MGQTLREAPPFNLHGLWLGSPIDPPELPEPSVEDWWSVQPPLNGPDMQGRKEGPHSKGEERSALGCGPHHEWMALGRPLCMVRLVALGVHSGLASPWRSSMPKAIEEKCFKNQPAWEKPHSWHSVWGSGERSPWSSSRSRCAPCSNIRCPKLSNLGLHKLQFFSAGPYVPLRLKASASECCLPVKRL